MARSVNRLSIRPRASVWLSALSIVGSDIEWILITTVHESAEEEVGVRVGPADPIC